MYVTTKIGKRGVCNTTSGLVLLKNGTDHWIPLSVMKKYKPVEVAEFAVARGVDHEPSFRWWVPYTLRCRDFIIAGFKSRVKRVTHKYGVELTHSVQEAYDLDEKNGNTLWRDALNREMEKLKVPFYILPEGRSPPSGYFRSIGHIIFDKSP